MKQSADLRGSPQISLTSKKSTSTTRNVDQATNRVKVYNSLVQVRLGEIKHFIVSLVISCMEM